MTQTILITGGAGFVGSNLAFLLKSKYPDWKIIALDSLKRRGSELNIPFLKSVGVEFLHGDIRNKEDLCIPVSLTIQENCGFFAVIPKTAFPQGTYNLGIEIQKRYIVPIKKSTKSINTDIQICI